MTLALVIPLTLHMLLFARGSIWRGKWTVLGISAVALLAGFPYCRYLLSGGIRSTRATTTTAGWVFPLLGPRVLSAQGLRYFFAPDWQLGRQGAAAVLGSAATIVSSLSFPLVWFGIGLTVHSALLRRREREPLTLRESVFGLAFAALCAQIVLNGATGTSRHPHYYNGTWIIFVLFAWLTVDFLARRGLGYWIAIPYLSAQLVAIGLLLSQIHTHGGSRAGFGPTIANQMNVAAELKQYSPQSQLRIDVLNYQLFPDAILALLQLAPEPSGQRPRANLAIVYTSNDPLDGRIKLIAQ
jgi:hypothetical protein